MFWWCSGVLVAFWSCSGVLVVFWCSNGLLEVFWCSGGVLEVLLDLLQPLQSVLAIQVQLRPLEMVSNDLPYPKTYGFKKPQDSSLL